MSVQPATIEAFYLAYLGRPPDDYYVDVSSLDPGQRVGPESALRFVGSPEFGMVTGSPLDASALVDDVYLRLFNRQAEASGIRYWTNEIFEGRLTVSQLPIAILQGAQNADALSVAHKLQAVDAFLAALDTAQERTGYSGADAANAARSYIESVDATDASLVTALAGVQSAVDSAVRVGQPPGNSFALTTAADTVIPGLNTTSNGQHRVPSSGNDIIAVAPGTLTSGDALVQLVGVQDTGPLHITAGPVEIYTG